MRDTSSWDWWMTYNYRHSLIHLCSTIPPNPWTTKYFPLLGCTLWLHILHWSRILRIPINVSHAGYAKQTVSQTHPCDLVIRPNRKTRKPEVSLAHGLWHWHKWTGQKCLYYWALLANHVKSQFQHFICWGMAEWLQETIETPGKVTLIRLLPKQKVQSHITCKLVSTRND